MEDNEIGIVESWEWAPEQLAEALGVDAIVKARIEKNRLMSDLESYGIEVAVHILNVLSPHSIWPWLPYGITRSKVIRANYSLVDRADELAIWTISFDEDANWRRRANEIIDETNRRAARKFPYRRK